MITIGISTLSSHLDELLDKLLKVSQNIDPRVAFLVVSQRETINDIYTLTDKITVIKSESSGLSNSRNEIINNTTTTWLWFQDDDIELNFTELSTFIDSLELSSADVACVKVNSLEKRYEEFKNYNFHNKHSKLNAFKISSIEIVVKTEFVKYNKISFDPKFGLGSSFPCCEENKFLIDCFKYTQSVEYIDVVTCFHTTNLNLRNIDFERNLYAKGVFLKELPIVYSLAFIFRWAWRVNSKFGFFKNLMILSSGYFLRQ